MASLTSLLESHRTAISDDFKQTLSALENKLNGVIMTVDEHEEKMETLKCEGDAREAKLSAAEEAIVNLQAANDKLAKKIIELESQSRRNNIRVIGLPEDIEGPQPTAFFTRMLEEVFKDVVESPVECERAHRSLAEKPKPNERPRPVIIRLLKFQVKDKIIRYARANRDKLNYMNHSILVFEDYPPEVVEQRKTYKGVMSELYERGLKPGLRYPARLHIKLKSGKMKDLASVAEAESYIASLPPVTARQQDPNRLRSGKKDLASAVEAVNVSPPLPPAMERQENQECSPLE